MVVDTNLSYNQHALRSRSILRSCVPVFQDFFELVLSIEPDLEDPIPATLPGLQFVLRGIRGGSPR